MPDTTPMMRQYWSVKEKHRDAFLFFRLGDFYEMFFDDAKIASKILDLTLTTRNKNQEDSVPLCGVPVHSAQSYINRLLSLGYKVAICEQTEDPALAKGIVKREVVQVLTPGLVLDPDCLEGKAHNYLVALSYGDHHWGLALADISTGVFKLSEFNDERKLFDELARLDAREMLLSDEVKDLDWAKKLLRSFLSIRPNFLPGWNFDTDFSGDFYRRFYGADFVGLGLADWPWAARAGGVLLFYLDESKLLRPDILQRPSLYSVQEFMVVDEATQRNLELLKTGENETRGSLFWLLDTAKTNMGSRLIKEWLLYPLIDVSQIQARQEAVKSFFSNPEILRQVCPYLENVSDLERIQNRILAERAHARDLVALKNSLEVLPGLKKNVGAPRGQQAASLQAIVDDLDCLQDIHSLIEKTLVDNPPLALKEGSLIREGVHAELDELRHIEKDGKSIISQMEALEREKTGISSLKIRFNRVFGYYIEITHTHRDRIPSYYLRKQTLTNAERFITPQLKEYEEKVLGAAERIKNLEYELFVELRSALAKVSERIKKTAHALACLDAFSALATVALERNYACPEIVEEPVIDIKAGRHPLVEVLHPEEPFVPNDLFLNTTDCRLILLTGPNMAGKSTVMRQVALICLMAQMGGFVPAASARLGLVDRIFTRIGASDHLQKGQSTFMVEMLETSQILALATEKSLVLLDEIGRGTSTFDGLSIAWAVAETLHDRIRARTLFATHYHELTDLAEEKEGIRNFHLAVREWKGEIRFLRELKAGSTNRSYGVHVAAMAGLPPETINRACEILKLLEEKDLDFRFRAGKEVQPSLFSSPEHPVIEALKAVSIDEMTPLSALNFLAKIKKEI